MNEMVLKLQAKMTEHRNRMRDESIVIVTTPELWDPATIEAAWRFLRSHGAKHE